MIEAHALTKRYGDTTAVDTGDHAGAGGGPVPASRRSWAPDLARGAVLLGIALANVGLYLHGTEMGPGLRPVDGSPLDRTLDFVGPCAAERTDLGENRSRGSTAPCCG